ncbi:Fluconazole resistance protein 1-like protein 1 [Pleurostoma richardsiae]|uniref:Fluconazole resistance protein 1-like protein 1 n=1 Tax=Pleurostoma richardsiae TaxID=41990 RepID=A0AA38S2Q3_9PEZI|nr:Fluconazole resistance protein 1-like protein 1 [Pleurostoma richardsiae]
MEHSLPTPPREDNIKSSGAKRSNSSGSKSVKSVHRTAKRTSTTHSHSHPQPSIHDNHSTHSMADGRHKRVWKACERCRMKKTKCDGEFPCKRCKDDGLVCTAGTRKKTEYKQLPRGYAEVLENTQFALIATVHKLYAMVRSGQSWDLGEPDLNERGQPVIHNIASKLGCIRPNSDIDLPVHSVFPEDEAGLADLAAQLEAQERERNATAAIKAETDSMCCNRTDRASSSELDHSDFEQDYRRSVFGGANSNSVTLSPPSLSYDSFDSYSAPSEGMPPTTSPTVPTTTSYPSWMTRPPTAPSIDFSAQQFLPQAAGFMDMDMLNQGLLESEFGTIKPHMLSCPNPEVMMGVGDPMIYSGYNDETLRL